MSVLHYRIGAPVWYDLYHSSNCSEYKYIVKFFIAILFFSLFFGIITFMEKQQIYDIIIDNLPVGFSIVDKDGIIIDFNNTAEKITGYTKRGDRQVPS